MATHTGKIGISILRSEGLRFDAVHWAYKMPSMMAVGLRTEDLLLAVSSETSTNVCFGYLTLKETAVPVPAAYTRHLSYDVSKDSQFNPHVYVETKRMTTESGVTEVQSLKGKELDNDQEEEVSTAATRSSLLIFLRDSRIYIRVLAVLIMIISLALILSAVVMFSKAQRAPGHSLDSVPHPPSGITDSPCIAFSGVAAMNLVLSVALLSLSCMSSKFRKSNNALNAVFAILSAIGFSSSMAACFHLNAQTKLENDLWKWSCSNHKNNVFSDALDFGTVCGVVSYGWKFGLVQASLELLTFVVSCTAFVLTKYAYFARYGRMGKIF
ncbi:uncharacterized protein LY89DRAFT_730359 [Mollisia scopiformis]|uniref:Uncharacterized protein n=1 Tax=Mollisia scopiformis TaxID=149040 RepID=A0A194XJM6_MOLSC|nr:uncharacterized protein LY89DRAFT_730359 [Mollisia scopiformis]KUJ20309.1 hypothetical protein LY89DRAFT_730359 [Mollisia scopiformis]